MLQVVGEVLELIIKETYGDLCAHIFALLCRYGCLSLIELVKHSRQSNLTVRRGLSVLIRAHLILWTSVNTPRSGNHLNTSKSLGCTELTRYEPDVKNAYSLIRSGKICDIFETRFGIGAAQIALHFLTVGHDRIDNVISQFKACFKARSTAVATPIDDKFSDIQCVENLQKLLFRLVQSGYLIEENVNLYKSDFVLHHEAEECVQKLLNVRKLSAGREEQADFESRVSDLKRKWIDEMYGDGISSTGTRAAKRFKIQHEILDPKDSHGNKDEATCRVPRLNPALILRVNPIKLSIPLCNDYLVTMCARYLGPTTSLVYQCILRLMECQKSFSHFEIRNLFNPEDDDMDPHRFESCFSVSTMEILQALDPSIDLRDGLGKSFEHHDDDDDDDDDDDEGSNPLSSSVITTRVNHLRAHLALLSSDPREFISPRNSSNDEQASIHIINNDDDDDDHESVHAERWIVQRRRILDYLNADLLFQTCAARSGAPAARLLRILADKGKLEESQLANHALLPINILRPLLTAQMEIGFIDAQELPRDASRLPARSVWLWSFTPNRASSRLLHDSLRTMSRILLRLSYQRSKFNNCICSDKQTAFLPGGQLNRKSFNNDRPTLSKLPSTTPTHTAKVKSQWSRVEHRLLVQLSRLDDVVALLTYFAPAPV